MRVTLHSASIRRTLRVAQYVFAITGILALGYWLTVYLRAKFYEIREARNFASELRRKEAGKAPTSIPHHAPVAVPQAPAPAPKNGSIVGRLVIPRIGVSVMVVQGVSSGDLRRAAGHIPGTALPGEPGNVGIAAHRDTFFRPLRFIAPNDTITLSTLQGAYRYRVVSTEIVKPDAVEVLYPTSRDTLTLVTCFPFYYVGSAPQRFIVHAERVPG